MLKLVLPAFRGHDASQITLALGTAAAYPRACQALGAMLSKGALNPADITVLFKMFSSMDPPPVELVRNWCTLDLPCSSQWWWPNTRLLFSGLQIRVPAFLDLFMQSLFKPGSKINQDHKYKYIHILAYAASVVETWKKVQGWEKVLKKLNDLSVSSFYGAIVSVRPLFVFAEQAGQHQQRWTEVDIQGHRDCAQPVLQWEQGSHWISGRTGNFVPVHQVCCCYNLLTLDPKYLHLLKKKSSKSSD